VRLELLGYQDTRRRWYERPQPIGNVVLLDQSAKRLYVAQTGLITSAAGVTLPNHLTPMTSRSRRAHAGRWQQGARVRFESPAVDGRKLVKTYTLQARRLHHRRAHEFINDGSEPVTPQLYLQLARDGNPPEGESSFYFTFTGPALYTEAGKFQKIDFSDIEKGKASHPRAPQRLGGDGAALLRLGLAGAGAQPREFRTAKVSDNHYSIAMVLPLGEVAPGASKWCTRRRCSPARRKRTSSPRWRRGWTWSRTTAGSPSCPSRCSGC
jgi:YidC/Oxa1 family membrane protein insertase